MNGDGLPKAAGTLDWYGACDPRHGALHGHATFSVAIFEWVPRARGGTRRGPVLRRIAGRSDQPQAVYDAADAALAVLREARAGQ